MFIVRLVHHDVEDKVRGFPALLCHKQAAPGVQKKKCIKDNYHGIICKRAVDFSQFYKKKNTSLCCAVENTQYRPKLLITWRLRDNDHCHFIHMTAF